MFKEEFPLKYTQDIENHAPQNEQEASEKRIILDYIRRYSDNVLLRENEIAHITSSGFIMNPALNKVLMVHHNIRGVWGWTGGHADGCSDLLAVAVREAQEETGARNIVPLSDRIASIDILTVRGHYKNGTYINAHLHLSIAYLLLCDELENLRSKPDENSGVAWFDAGAVKNPAFSNSDVYVYSKLTERARRVAKEKRGE